MDFLQFRLAPLRSGALLKSDGHPPEQDSARGARMAEGKKAVELLPASATVCRSTMAARVSIAQLYSTDLRATKGCLVPVGSG